MDINNLKLSEELLTNLYPSVLIQDAFAPSKLAQSPKKTSKNYLGNNSRHILICCRFGQAAFIPDADLEFLTSILGACKLSLGDVAILNLHGKEPAEAAVLIRELLPETVLLFGIHTNEIDLPVRFPMFQRQSLQNRLYLAAPPLEDIKNSKDLKQQLWGALRLIFKI